MGIFAEKKAKTALARNNSLLFQLKAWIDFVNPRLINLCDYNAGGLGITFDENANITNNWVRSEVERLSTAVVDLESRVASLEASVASLTATTTTTTTTTP